MCSLCICTSFSQEKPVTEEEKRERGRERGREGGKERKKGKRKKGKDRQGG